MKKYTPHFGHPPRCIQWLIHHWSAKGTVHSIGSANGWRVILAFLRTTRAIREVENPGFPYTSDTIRKGTSCP